MTTYSEILTDYAMTLIDDPRWQRQLAENAAVFFRAKSLYVTLGIPRFCRPPQAVEWLAVEKEPAFDDYAYVAEEVAEVAPVVINTYKKGFDLCCVGITSIDEAGNPFYTPIKDFTYDKESGIVTIQHDLLGSTVVSMDFYSDGVFKHDLSVEMKRILGLCVQTVWENRFSSAYLMRTQKVTDKSFATPNESTWTKEQREKGIALESHLNDELYRFEQNYYYHKVVPRTI